MMVTLSDVLPLIREGFTVRFREDGSVQSISSPAQVKSQAMTQAERASRYRANKRAKSVTEGVTLEPGNVTASQSNETQSETPSPSLPPPSSPGTPPSPAHTPTPAYTHEARKAPSVEVSGFPPPITIKQAKQAAENAGIPAEAGEFWWLDHDKRGWVDKQGHRVANWRSSLIAFGRQWQSYDRQRAAELAAKRSAAAKHARPGETASKLKAAFA